jgi:hypothetical protein
MPIEVVQQDHLNSSIGRGVAFVSVLTHGPQLNIDVLKVYNASARLVHHIIIIQKLLVRLISDILIILI